MATITLPPLPTDEEEAVRNAFVVNLHYLQHLEIYLRHEYGAGDALYDGLGAAIARHPAYLKLQRQTAGIDDAQLARHLEIGWVSELQLAVPAAVAQPFALRYTNAWAPIHAYYASYMLLQAWFDTNRMRATDHAATLKSIASQIKQRQLFPQPWGVLCEGNAIAKTCTYPGEPTPGACAQKLEVLTIPIGLAGAFAEAEFWARLGTWLRTTREYRLRLREHDWKKKHNRQSIAPKVRRQFAQELHPTSLFECLWRLRNRSNYRSVEPYLSDFVSDGQVERFHGSLFAITRADMFLLEAYVARRYGAGAYDTVVQRFLDRDPQGLANSTVGARAPRVVALARTPGATP